MKQRRTFNFSPGRARVLKDRQDRRQIYTTLSVREERANEGKEAEEEEEVMEEPQLAVAQRQISNLSFPSKFAISTISRQFHNFEILTVWQQRLQAFE